MAGRSSGTAARCQGVSYDGTMDMSGSGSAVYVTNGLTLAGVNGTGSGTINLTGQAVASYAQGSETLSNATINIGNSSTYDYIYNYDNAGDATLTLGIERHDRSCRQVCFCRYVGVQPRHQRHRQCRDDQRQPERWQLHHAGGGFFTNQGPSTSPMAIR